MKRLFFVFNPHSGKGLIKNYLLKIIDTFVKAGYSVEISTTQKRLDAKEQVIEKAGSCDLIVCAGGDGTLNEVVSGIMESGCQVPVGYIPAGSTNDFASSIHLPKRMGQAAKIAVEGTPFAVDMGTFNGRTFVYVAGFGAFTDVSYATPQNLKNVLGHQAYILEGMKKLASIKAYDMYVEWEDEVIEDKFIYGMVTNAKSVGGFSGITGPNVALDDGKFEVTLIKKIRNPIELQSVLSYLLRITKKSERVVSFKTHHICFESNGEVPWVLDGEYGGQPRRAEIRNHKQCVSIMVPEKKPVEKKR
jgi:YegS/Rv2252/BmrU family lipid kinase